MLKVIISWIFLVSMGLAIGFGTVVVYETHINPNDQCIATQPYKIESQECIVIERHEVVGCRMRIEGSRERSGDTCWIEGLVNFSEYGRWIND